MTARPGKTSRGDEKEKTSRPPTGHTSVPESSEFAKEETDEECRERKHRERKAWASSRHSDSSRIAAEGKRSQKNEADKYKHSSAGVSESSLQVKHGMYKQCSTGRAESSQPPSHRPETSHRRENSLQPSPSSRTRWESKKIDDGRGPITNTSETKGHLGGIFGGDGNTTLKISHSGGTPMSARSKNGMIITGRNHSQKPSQRSERHSTGRHESSCSNFQNHRSSESSSRSDERSTSNHEASSREQGHREPDKRHKGSLSSFQHHGKSRFSSTNHGQSTSNHESSSRKQSQHRREIVIDRPKERVRTENMLLGNMDRTWPEEFKIPTIIQQAQQGPFITIRDIGRSSKRYSSKKINMRGLIPDFQYANHPQGTYRNVPANTVSMAPARTLKVFKSEEDKQRLSQHAKLSTLNPRDNPDVSKHHEWAGTKIQHSAPCPQGYPWARVQRGYLCAAKHHYITDELFTEGHGGMWVVPDGDEGNFEKRWGPYYAEPEHPTWFMYCGLDPIPEDALPTLGEGQQYYPEFRKKLMERRQKQKTAQTSPGSIMQTWNDENRPSHARSAHGSQRFGTNGYWGQNQK